MTLSQKLLTGILLVLTGVMLGMIIMVYYAGVSIAERNEIRIVEVKRSVTPSENYNEVLDRTDFSPDLRAISRSATNAVVYIETTVALSRPEVPQDDNHTFDERMWERMLPRRRATTIGSGVLVSPDGYIITNNHVIAGADAQSITVTLNDKRFFPASVIGRDPSTDLAVLKIDGLDLPHAVIGNSDAVEVGDWVVAVGNPFRLRSTVTAGIVSALGRNVDIISDQLRVESFIQTDAAINRGNSGGALINSFGELVGINTAIATENGSYQGYGFAIPINMAFKISRDLIEFGEVRRAFLGVSIMAIGQDRARQLGLSRIQGVEIVNIARNGAADLGGLRLSDVIIDVDGFEVNEANELQARIALQRPGDSVVMTIWRNGELLPITLRVNGLENENVRNWLQR
jgi:serine protease Do